MSIRPLLPFVFAFALLAAAPIAQVGTNRGLLNANLATKEDLAKVPHFTEELIEGLVEHRPYLGMVALNERLRATLDAEKLAEVYAKLWVPIDLNAASEEEILLIPGVGKRMAHEFEEYRPYDGLPRFRREMKKYVDEKEVARLEQYVFLKLDLNEATPEELATIPGVGKRLIHEFQEYRPYADFAQFRREIGKYVDEKEVARLERYFELDSDMPAGPADAGRGPTPEPAALALLRRALLAIVAVGALGTLAELVLLEHYEDNWQWAPLVLLSVVLVALAFHASRPSQASVRALRAAMLLCAVGGLLGLWRHYRGNVEFELEMVPTRKGLELVWEALTGATPALAPGALVHLGLVGLAAVWRHPASRAPGA